MVRNSNKFNVSDDTHMNTASNNTVVDWCTALNYSAEQIQWSLGNPDPQAIRKILGHLISQIIPVHYYYFITIIIIIIIINIICILLHAVLPLSGVSLQYRVMIFRISPTPSRFPSEVLIRG